MSRHLVNVMDRDETDAEIIARLQRTWEIWGPRHVEPLKRLIASLDSGETISLSGIDRDLIVYAMALASPQLPNGERQ